MSTAEMKLEAIREITKLHSEKALKQVLLYLSEMNETENVINLSQHYDKSN